MLVMRMKLVRTLALLVCLALAPMALGEQPYFVVSVSAEATLAEECDVRWASIEGYSIVCDSWPHEPMCPDDGVLEGDCEQWCMQWENNVPQSWGCSLEVPWSYEMWCGCWLAT
jgi:hypothetical protein